MRHYSFLKSASYVLIETSWNVKNFLFVDRSIVRMVLIETSWNVKSTDRAYTPVGYGVLIETSWNVKPEVFPSTVQNRSPY